MEEEIETQLWLGKALAVLGCGALAVGGCWAARRLEMSKGKGGPLQDTILVMGNTVAAGILLAASLTHMLPDASEALQDVTDFPLAPAIAGATFCFLVILGEAVGYCMPRREEPHTQTACVAYGASFALWPRKELMPPHGCEEAGVAATTDERACAQFWAAQAGTAPSSLNTAGCCEQEARLRQEARLCQECSPEPSDHDDPPDPPLVDLPAAVHAALPGHSCHSHSSCCRVHRHADEPCLVQSAATAPGTAQLVEPLLAAHAHAGVPHARHMPHEADLVSRCHVRAVGTGPIAEVKAFLLFGALCFHSVTEGLGMGSAQGAGLLLPVVLAILAHKGLAAFALGCSLTQSELPAWKFWTFVLIFASGTPFGCLVGMLSVQIAGAATQGVVSGVCIALASGTFLQVSSMELLPRVLAEEDRGLLGGCGLGLGFAAMSFLAIWC
mmetsp:Transcript_95378/g.296527  ORF Transcript_95378/g.296527 Transcript_95378/m.296527 type:complete len:442 (-) Transcript_95378:104-1429(-)